MSSGQIRSFVVFPLALLVGSQRVAIQMPVVGQVHIDRTRPWSAFGGIDKRGRINEHNR